MWLPEGLEQRRFKDWNRLVRELMEVWETAYLLGKEVWFQEQLEACAEENELRERLAELRLKLATEATGTGYNLAESGNRIAAPDGPDTTPPADTDQPEPDQPEPDQPEPDQPATE